MFLRTLLALCLTSVSQLAALELSPHYGRMEADGLTKSALYFQDGHKRVFVEPPPGWDCTGGARSAVFRCGKMPRSSILFTLSPTPMLPEDATQRERLDASVLASVPKGTTGAEIVRSSVDPLQINGWRSYQVQVSYLFNSTRFFKSVLFIRLNLQEELQVIVSATEEDFPAVGSAMSVCLNSWHKE